MNTDKPETHLNKYKKQQNTIIKSKDTKFLQTKAQIQSKLFTAFRSWPIYATHGGINYRDERL